MKIKKNDVVLILTGKDAGKTGKVLTAMPAENKVLVEGVNVQKKHKKARSTQEQSAIVEQVGAIDASNVEIVCSACKKATRVAYKIVDGKKIRVCRKCGASLDVEAKKAEEKSTKKTTTRKTTKKAEATDKVEEKPAKKTTTRKTTKKAETTDKVEEKPAKKTTKKADTTDGAEKPKRTRKTTKVEG